MNTGNYPCIVSLLLILLTPVPSCAQVTFYVAADGDKAFNIEGDDINAKSIVELTVGYDSQSLTNPQVSLTQGTVTKIDDSVTDTLLIKAIQGDDSTATFEVHLSFDRTGDKQGGIRSVTGTIIDPDGTEFSTVTLPAASSPLILPSVFKEDDTPAGKNVSSNDSPEIVVLERSVLQQFRDFKGKRGLKTFVTLFNRSLGEKNIQDPPIVLSDGKTPVEINPSLLKNGGEVPDIALSDAKLIDLRKDDEKGWVITALPNQGTWDARLIIKSGNKVFEFPIVVAPPVKILKNITESNFLAELDRFVARRAGAGTRENNPSRQVLLEYIFTANYLASLGKGSSMMTSCFANLVHEYR
jgi:hypothetical protein